MEAKNVDNELTAVLLQTRKLVIDMKHGFIGNDHLLLAMLTSACLASKYLNAIEIPPLEKLVSESYPATASHTLKDDLALTIVSERTIKHAYAIAKTNDELSINSVHLLLAMLSYEDTIVKTTLDKAGILIEDITADYFKKPVKSFQAPIKAIRTKPYNKMGILLLNITGKKSDQIKELYHNALYLYWYYLYHEAISVCNVGLTLSPNHAGFKDLIAYSTYQLRDYKTTLHIMQQLIDSNPDQNNIDYKISMAYMYEMTGNLNQSAEILDGILLQDPDNALVLNNKGFNLAAQEKYAESIPYLEKAIAIDPTMAFALNNLGFSKFRTGETNEAISLIDKSLTLHKGNSYAYKNKGIILTETGNKEEALKYFKLALKYGYTEKYGDEVSQILSTYNLVN